MDSILSPFLYNIIMNKIKIEHINTYGWNDALRGMRNPLNSWNRGDSSFKYDSENGSIKEFKIGPNDEKLIKALTHGG